MDRSAYLLLTTHQLVYEVLLILLRMGQWRPLRYLHVVDVQIRHSAVEWQSLKHAHSELIQTA